MGLIRPGTAEAVRSIGAGGTNLHKYCCGRHQAIAAEAIDTMLRDTANDELDHILAKD